MDETSTATTTTVFVLEQQGHLTGPFAQQPEPSPGQTVHETAGHVHAFNRDRDWFECPWCRSEVTGEELRQVEDLFGFQPELCGHECDESTLDR